MEEDQLNLRDWGRIFLRGVGQVMFQESAWTGAFFVAGLACSSLKMAAGALIGSAVGTLTAYALRFPRRDIERGLYGFNAALVGVAVLFYDRPVAVTLLVTLLAAAASAVVTHAMRRHLPFPSYTAPFVVTTWVALAALRQMGAPAESVAAAVSDVPLPMTIADGIAQVMFQASAITGVLFLIGILLNEWRDAFWAVIGSAIGVLIANWRNDPATSIAVGIYSYNATLAAMALALYRPSILLPIVAAALSVFVTEWFPTIGLETLTAPFVLASWLTIAAVHLERTFGLCAHRR